MTDARTEAERADEARDVEKTEEQLWKDFANEEKGIDPDHEPDDDPEPDAEPDDDQGTNRGPDPTDDDNPPDEDDKRPSEDKEEGADKDGNTDGMDPEALRKQNERLEHSLKSSQGRLKAKEREIEALQRQLADAEKKPRRTKEDEDRLTERRQKLEEAQKEYGDVIGPLADHITELEGRLDRLSQQEAKDLERAQARYEELLEVEEEAFLEEHPDGFEVLEKNKEAFAPWIEDQPKRLRDIFAANQQAIVNGEEAAYLVGKFKEALLDAEAGSAPDPNERLQTRRQRQLAGARSTRTSGRQQASSAPPKDADDPAAHWDYWKRKERAD